MTISPVLDVRVVRGEELELFSGVTTLLAPYSADTGVRVDGAISQGEYDSSVTWTTPDTGISFTLIHDNGSLYAAIDGPAWSWVALGISSDGAATMGFVLIAKTGSGYDVQERMTANVSESIVLSSVSNGNPKAVKEFEVTSSGNHTVAELRLSLDSSLWTLAPGVVYPTVVATNLTASQGFPTALSGDQVHFMGSYLLRQEDSVKNVMDLLNGTMSPVPSLVAVALLGLGVVAILVEFVVRRRKE
jgi:hypothetical protein